MQLIFMTIVILIASFIGFALVLKLILSNYSRRKEDEDKTCHSFSESIRTPLDDEDKHNHIHWYHYKND